MATDVRLNDLFGGEEETSSRNVPPEAEEIPQHNKDNESGGLVCQIKGFCSIYTRSISHFCFVLSGVGKV